MENPPVVRKGNRVRVVLEGTATYVGGHHFEIGDMYSNSVHASASHVKSVEVLVDPIKVGDVVRVSDVNDQLPIGTVVTLNATVLMKVESDRWRQAHDDRLYHSDTMLAFRMVAVLPNADVAC